MTQKPRLILGSASVRRKEILAQIGIIPDVIAGADIDETPQKNELPRAYCMRMAKEKLAVLAQQFPNDFIITADTIGSVGRRILGKPENREEAKKMLQLLSGRSHDIITAVCVYAPDNRQTHRILSNHVTMKRISTIELEWYLDTNDWQGKSSGYAFGLSIDRFIKRINGSSSSIIGIPAFETVQMLVGLGYPLYSGH
jgi:septum formation protein